MLIVKPNNYIILLSSMRRQTLTISTVADKKKKGAEKMELRVKFACIASRNHEIDRTQIQKLKLISCEVDPA